MSRLRNSGGDSAAAAARHGRLHPLLERYPLGVVIFCTSILTPAATTAFVMMTFLTMVASVTFDPRLMWDVAGRRGSDRGCGVR